MRRPFVVLVVALAACSGASDAATSTTAGSASTSAQSQTIVPGGLVPADPATLVPYEDAQPLVVASYHDGVVSPNGRWAAIFSRELDQVDGEVNVIDLDTSAILASRVGSGEGLTIDDRGQAAWLEDGALRLLSTDMDEIVANVPLAPARLRSTLEILGDGRIVYLSAASEHSSPVSIVVVDPASGADAVSYQLVGVTSGASPEDSGDDPPHSDLIPAVAWDEGDDRALVVSNTDNIVVEVNLSTGTLTEHTFQAFPLSGFDGAGRDTFLSPAGDVLVVATRVREVEDAGEGGLITEEARDLITVDTRDWTAATADQSVWSLWPSPDGAQLAGSGAVVSWDSEGNGETVDGPVFLIDASTGRPLVGFEGRSGGITEVQFSADGAEMYVVSEGAQGSNIDIVDVGSQGLAGSLGFARISLIGEAGLLAFHLD